MSGHFLWAALISLTHKIESRKAETLWREECECLRGNKKKCNKKKTRSVSGWTDVPSSSAVREMTISTIKKEIINKMRATRKLSEDITHRPFQIVSVSSRQ